MAQAGPGQDLAAASPITYVTPDDPPFLLIHGTKDELVPYEQAQLMYERLVQASVPAQLVTVQNGNHALTAPGGAAAPSLPEIDQIIRDFLAKYLR